MADPGFISGMIGYAIQLAGNQIIERINIAVRCRKELDALKHLVDRILSMNMELQEYRKALNSGKVHASFHHPLPSAVNSWLNKLNDLLQEASDLAQHCTVPSSWLLISRYQTSIKISRLISVIEEHLNSTPSIAFLHQLQQDAANRQGQQQIQERIDSLKKSIPTLLASTSGDFSPSTSSAPPKRKYIKERLIVGQDHAFTKLEMLIDLAQHKSVSRIGLVGMGGSGKTLLLKRVFNSSQVQTLFSSGLMLWLTISKTPSFEILRNDLVTQISLRINERLDSREEDDVKIWLSERLRENKFAMFLDDVWGRSASSLLTELCVPLSPHSGNSNIIIATSRSRSVLLQVGVADASIIEMQDLGEEDSWQLFCFHAFPHNDGIIPVSIDEETASRICSKCGGLPLALQVIGHAMAGVTESNEWRFALGRLQNAENYGDVTDLLYGRLRLSYDALVDIDICLQLCFLYLSAFSEDEVMYSAYVSKVWIGEGFVTGQDPLRKGQRFVNLLADRCLIEPLIKDRDGNVFSFRVHDVLHDLAQQIAEKEENCYFHAGQGIKEFPADDYSTHTKISLMNNGLTNVPNIFGSSHIQSWLMRANPQLTKIPEQVIRRMISLRILDLSGTAIESLSKSLGSLKHLVFLNLAHSFIKRLPNSITALTNLQILNLNGSHITELPTKISKLTSLKHLNISDCEHLQSIPYGISELSSLEYLSISGCPNGWRGNKYKRKLLSIIDLGCLNQLKMLELENNGETIREGMLENMKDMEIMFLKLTKMEILPHDITTMSKLKKLYLKCPQLLQIEDSFCRFQHLSHIRLFNCEMLKQLPALHKIVSLKGLVIAECYNIEELPEDFGKRGAFPKLEVFFMVALQKLEELPLLEEGAMPSLQRLAVMECEALQMLPQSYWNLNSVEKIEIYGCSMAVTAMENNIPNLNTKVQTVTVSTPETQAMRQRFHEMVERGDDMVYGEIWSNDLFRFLSIVYHNLEV